MSDSRNSRRPKLLVVGTATLALALTLSLMFWWTSSRLRVPTVSPVDFGAVGDGRTDDTAALQRAFNTVPEGGTVTLPSGKVFAHSQVLTLARRNVRVTGGGTLLATREATSEFLVRADGVRIEGITLAIAATTRRWDAYEQMKLRIGPSSGVVISDVNITGSAASGIFVGGARNFQIIRVTVRDTRADGVHITEGSYNGKVSGSQVLASGDDGFAVVSYRDFPICNYITISNSKVSRQKWGRAFAVVGGQDISMDNIYAEYSSSAGVYLASEANYNTWPVARVLINGATLLYSNQTVGVDQGAVMLYNGQPGTINRDIRMYRVKISDTRASAPWNVGILNASRAVQTGIQLDSFNLTAGPSRPCYSNASPSSYRLTNWVVNGKAATFTTCAR